MQEFFTQKRTIFALLTIAVLSVVIPLTLSQVRTRQETRSQAAFDVAFGFSPQTASKAVNETFDVQLSLNGGTFDVSGVDIIVSFDANILELVSFQPSATFNSILRNTPNNANGTLVLTALNTTATPITGTITLGTATFKTKAEGSAAVGITKSQVTASGQPNALEVDVTQTGSYVVTVVPTETVTSTPQPSQIPTPTPTTQPTNTPVPSEIPTPTPTLQPGQPSPTPKASGDADGVDGPTITDYNIWKDEFLGATPNKSADFDNDNQITVSDYNMWRNAFLKL